MDAIGQGFVLLRPLRSSIVSVTPGRRAVKSKLTVKFHPIPNPSHPLLFKPEIKKRI